MERIRKSLRYHRKKLMSMENVVGMGMGYKIINGETTNQPAVMVLVKKKLPESKLRSRQVIPKMLNEIVTDVIEVGEVRLLADRTDKARPAMPGMSLGHYKVTAGTFGALVKDANTGESLILSNNHVLANASDGRDGRCALGDDILQPGAYDGGTASDVIARLERFVPISKNTTQDRCSLARGVENVVNAVLKLVKPNYRLKFIKNTSSRNLVDAALAKPIKPEYVTGKIFDLGELKGTVQPKIGMQIKKSGRTTGITTSEIKALEVVLKVMLGEGEEATFYEQILAGPMAQPGDSGSIVVDENMMAVGLLFAGSEQSTIINPIVNVMKLLKITF
jgi:hypothetical protein